MTPTISSPAETGDCKPYCALRILNRYPEEFYDRGTRIALRFCNGDHSLAHDAVADAAHGALRKPTDHTCVGLYKCVQSSAADLFRQIRRERDRVKNMPTELLEEVNAQNVEPDELTIARVCLAIAERERTCLRGYTEWAAYQAGSSIEELACRAGLGESAMGEAISAVEYAPLVLQCLLFLYFVSGGDPVAKAELRDVTNRRLELECQCQTPNRQKSAPRNRLSPRRFKRAIRLLKLAVLIEELEPSLIAPHNHLHARVRHEFGLHTPDMSRVC